MTFGSKTASEITGASARQLGYWDREGVVKPSVRPATGRGSVRLYSFFDLVQISVALALRHGGVKLESIRKSMMYFREHPRLFRHPSPALTFVTDGDDVFVLSSAGRTVQAALRKGPMLWVLAVGQIGIELADKAKRMIEPERTAVTVDGKRYPVRIEADPIDGGFVVFAERSPRCESQGETSEEALKNIADAISECLLARTKPTGVRARAAV
jgi:DNA-binding transcriptional MerR regulator